MTLATAGQIRAIHAERRRVGLDEDAYRAALAGFGVTSSKELSKDAAAAFIDRLKGGPGASPLPNPPPPLRGSAEPRTSGQGGREKPLARGALRLDGPYAGVCRALWLSAWNLGLLRDRTDKALAAFVKRQTGLDSPNWMRDPADGAKAIEALKGWIARPIERGGAGVAWPSEAAARKAGVSWGRARKLAVIAAQRRMLGALARGVFHPCGSEDAELGNTRVPEFDPGTRSDDELDEMTNAFGRAIRAAKQEEG